MRQGFSPARTAALAATLVVLGVVGWSTGWLVAGAEVDRRGQGTRTSSPVAASEVPTTSPTTAPSPSPSAEPSDTPAPTPTRTDAFAMPDLVGKDFREARAEAAEARLGVHIVFGESGGPDGTVVATNPKSGIFVFPGLTILLYVAGEAPKLKVPDVAGKPCREGRDALLRAGLLIEGYPSGVKGTVRKTDPAAGTEVTWNTQIEVFCAEGATSEGYPG